MKIFSASFNLPKVWIICTASVLLIPVFGSAQQVITIQQAVDSALKNNLTIRQAEFSAALTDVALTQSKNALLPTLNGSLSPSVNFGRGLDQNTFQVVNQTSFFLSGGLSTNISLFEGGAKMNQIRQNKVLFEADKTNIKKVKNDLILQVVTSYLQILYNTDLLKASKEQLGVATQTLKREQELINVGNKTLADLSQAKSQLATADLSVTNAQNALEISYLTLGQLMELPTTQTFTVQAPLYDEAGNIQTNVNPNEVYNNALSTFPDIELYRLRTEAAKIAIASAKGSYYPRISLSGSMSSSYSYQFGYNGINPGTGLPISQTPFGTQISDRFGQGIGMNISIPIFNGFNARSSVKRATINYNNAKLGEQIVRNNLSKTIYQATADLRAAEARYKSTTNTFLAEKDAYNVIEQRYNVGLVNSLDYATSRTNKNKAEADMIQAKYDLLFRAKVIDYYLGRQITF